MVRNEAEQSHLGSPKSQLAFEVGDREQDFSVVYMFTCAYVCARLHTMGTCVYVRVHVSLCAVCHILPV